MKTINVDELAEMLGIVRHGHWIWKEFANKNESWYQCSECDAYDLCETNVKSPYCWACGAKMDGDHFANDGKKIPTMTYPQVDGITPTVVAHSTVDSDRLDELYEEAKRRRDD